MSDERLTVMVPLDVERELNELKDILREIGHQCDDVIRSVTRGDIAERVQRLEGALKQARGVTDVG